MLVYIKLAAKDQRSSVEFGPDVEDYLVGVGCAKHRYVAQVLHLAKATVWPRNNGMEYQKKYAQTFDH